MLTNDIQAINNARKVTYKFASVAYNDMMTKRYGIKPCKQCGNNDKVGKYNIHILEYEKMILSEMSEENCCSEYKPVCPPCKQHTCDSMGCGFDLIEFSEIDKMVNGLNNI